MPINKKEPLEVKEIEERVSIFDPSINAYREVPKSLALKFIESAKEVEQKLEEEK